MASQRQGLRDPNTLSNYDDFKTTHTVANLSIDFSKEQLAGNVTLILEATASVKTGEITLDTSYLDVLDVKVRGSSTKWDLLSRTEPYGSALKVQAGSVKLGTSVTLDIRVQTTKECTALQWLTPEQTSNKKYPYMYSLCQPIHARSIFPCQDTPDVKSTFEFNLRSPLPVIASGLSTGASHFEPGKDGLPGTLLYSFVQDVPIPNYLFAIASGDIATASIGPWSTVVTGPEELEDAQWELEEDTERFIQTAEGILQNVPYAWTTYNVLVLPPSFPCGGMENPVSLLQLRILSLAAPIQDRENVDVIAHELSHSWSGNLVSNASWEHFWLNEGWITYLERRIQAAVHGEPRRSFSAIIGWKAISDAIAQLGVDHEFTKLVIDLKGKDPDKAFSSIPYEKGFTFLYHLENLLGKQKWDTFIPHYFSTFARKSPDSYQFKETLLSFFASDPEASQLLKCLYWDKWFFAPGFPPKPDFDTSLVDVCYALADKWEGLQAQNSRNFTPSAYDIKGWSANQVVVFLERVQHFKPALARDHVKAMGEVHGFSKSQNVEIVSRFLRVGLRAGHTEVYEPTVELLGTVGRMKFVRPLYRDLKEADRDLAAKTSEKNEMFYHPICRQLVRQDLYGKK